MGIGLAGIKALVNENSKCKEKYYVIREAYEKDLLISQKKVYDSIVDYFQDLKGLLKEVQFPSISIEIEDEKETRKYVTDYSSVYDRILLKFPSGYMFDVSKSYEELAADTGFFGYNGNFAQFVEDWFDYRSNLEEYVTDWIKEKTAAYENGIQEINNYEKKLDAFINGEKMASLLEETTDPMIDFSKRISKPLAVKEELEKDLDDQDELDDFEYAG